VSTVTSVTAPVSRRLVCRRIRPPAIWADVFRPRRPGSITRLLVRVPHGDGRPLRRAVLGFGSAAPLDR